MRYPKLADELVKLLEDDQQEWRAFAKIEFKTENKSSLRDLKASLRERVHTRAQSGLRILGEIG